jgi:thiol-disulfide isomerase/thioredoxin
MKKLLALFAFASALFCMTSSFAEDPASQIAPASPSAGKIDPKAADVMKKFSDMMLKAKNFKFDLDMNIKITANGMNQEISNNAEFAAERPNKILYDIKKGMMPLKVVSDGKNTYTYIPAAKKYNVDPAEADFGKLKCMDLISRTSGFPLIESFVSDNPYEKQMTGVVSGKYVGVEKIGDKECHHLSFQQAEFDWDAWIETGDKPLLRKFVPDMKKQLDKAMEKDAIKDMKYNMVFTLDNWSVSSDLPADLFKFTPPADAKKTDPSEMAPKSGKSDGDTEESHPSLGKDAPVFKLDLLDGKSFDLASVKSKKIIVLDFWATWCPPCRKALPILAEVTAGYADKDVVFYAVNLQEDKDKINEFLTKEGIKCTVAMDKNSDAAKLYNVEGIPQSVIIGKDGIVQAVHVGLVPDLKDLLKQELDDLIAGKSLIKKDK